MTQLIVGIVSDGTGETAEAMVKAALSQFPDLECRILPYAQVRDESRLAEVIAHIQSQGIKLVVTTLLDTTVRQKLADYCQKEGIALHFLLTPLLEKVTHLTGCQPTGTPGAQRQIDAAYLKRIKAMEFTITCDDGKSPQLWNQADLVLYGVSRAGKTPLSLFLADRGVAVANVPLLPGIEPDPRAYDVAPQKRVGLIISPQRLREIRLQRLALMGLDPDKAFYAQEEHIQAELAQARSLMEKLGCRIYESTDQPLEVLGLQILYDFHLI